MICYGKVDCSHPRLIIVALVKAKKVGLVQNIVSQLEEEILDGTYRSGDKLPSQQNLQKMLGASQGTLREALRILEQKGLIEIRLGVKGGPFVKSTNTEKITESLELLMRQKQISMDELAEFRKPVESELLRLLTKRLKKSDFKEIKIKLAGLKKQADRGSDGWADYLLAEIELRKTLFRLAGNRMFEAVLVSIHNNIKYINDIAPIIQSDPQIAYRDWKEIIQALQDKNADKAILITRRHIERYRRLFNKQKSLLF